MEKLQTTVFSTSDCSQPEWVSKPKIGRGRMSEVGTEPLNLRQCNQLQERISAKYAYEVTGYLKLHLNGLSLLKMINSNFKASL